MERDILQSFLLKLFTYLTGQVHASKSDLKIFRKHNNKLNSSGDLSFPLNLSGWKKHMQSCNIENTNIFYYVDKFDKNKLNENHFHKLIDETETWNTLHIEKIKLHENKINLYLNRERSFKLIIDKILSEKAGYGLLKRDIQPVVIKIEEKSEKFTTLTLLRLTLLKNVIENILQIEANSQGNSTKTVYLTDKINTNYQHQIVCGPVISNGLDKKPTNISVEQFYKKRTTDMQLMAQHKYGLRVNSEPGWTEFFKLLGDAAVKIDLLHAKPTKSIIIKEDCSSGTSSKGASFILYNCARLSEIFKRFELKVSTGEAQALPSIEDVDFNLLNQSEEWELLFVYLMQFGTVVDSCVEDILDCKLNIHNLCMFLDSLCSTFSIYYRRVRVLTESRPHLVPVMYARIYLLKAIQQVLHNALALLNVTPVKQM